MAAADMFIDVDSPDKDVDAQAVDWIILDVGESPAKGLGQAVAGVPSRSGQGHGGRHPSTQSGAKSYRYVPRSASRGTTMLILEGEDIPVFMRRETLTAQPTAAVPAQASTKPQSISRPPPQNGASASTATTVLPSRAPAIPVRSESLIGAKRPRSVSPLPTFAVPPNSNGKGQQSPTHATSGADDPDVSILKDRAIVAKFFEDLWPSDDMLTSENFLLQAKRIVRPDQVLKKGDFWTSFRSIEFCGEGSFGFVWRCVTFDGDEVAVKAAPIQFSSPAAIDDGFSVLREIASLRCLNDRNIDGVLPLHAAFLVEAPESLPPHLMTILRQEQRATEIEAAKIKRERAKAREKAKAEAAKKRAAAAKERAAKQKAKALEKSKKAAAAMKKKPQAPAKGAKKGAPAGRGAGGRGRGRGTAARGRGRGAKNVEPEESDSSEEDEDEEPQQEESSSDDTSSVASNDSTDFSEADVLDPADDVRFADVKSFPLTLPKFVGLTREDALTSDVTVITITNLCDGDLEALVKKIPSEAAAEAFVEEVGYSIAKALKGMHRGGMLHLDLKPANILWRRRLPEHSLPAGLSPLSPRKSSTKVPPLDLYNPRQLEFFLSDFGNVHIVGPGADEATDGAIGTYEYMDTMALDKRRCDRHTDTFSLGCVLFEIATRGQLMQPTCPKAHNHAPRCYIPQSKQETPQQQKVIASLRPAIAQIIRGLTHRERRYRMTAAGCFSAVSLLREGVAIVGARNADGVDDSDEEAGLP